MIEAGEKGLEWDLSVVDRMEIATVPKHLRSM